KGKADAKRLQKGPRKPAAVAPAKRNCRDDRLKASPKTSSPSRQQLDYGRALRQRDEAAMKMARVPASATKNAVPGPLVLALPDEPGTFFWTTSCNATLTVAESYDTSNPKPRSRSSKRPGAKRDVHQARAA